MKNTPRRLIRFCAAATAFFYFSAFVAPLGLWADPPPKKTKSFKNSKSKEKASKLNLTGEGDYPRVTIGPGDFLSIFVYGENGVLSAGGGGLGAGTTDLLPTDYLVDSDGTITFPFLGQVSLDGLTPAEASTKIAKLLSKPRKVTVLMKESSTFWVSVLGNVPRPGKFQIEGRPTLLSVLSLAGGPLPDTDMGGAILIHNKVKTKIDLDKYLRDTGKKMDDPYLYPGDVLMVQHSGWPTIGEWAIVASILASLAVVTVDLSQLKK